MSAIGFASLVLLGVSLLVAVRLIYQDGPRGPDAVYFVLKVAGWTIFYLGLMGAMWSGGSILGLLLWVFTLITSIMVLQQYRAVKYQSMIDAISLAMKKQIGLEGILQAFSHDEDPAIGLRAQRIGQWLREGMALADACEKARIPLPIGHQLALRMERPLDDSLGVSDVGGDRVATAHSSQTVFGETSYLLMMLFVAFTTTSFCLIKIVPQLEKILESFGTQVPMITQVFIRLSEAYAVYLLPLVLLQLGLFGVVGLAVYQYAHAARVNFPVVGRLWIRLDGALILRSLAVPLRNNQPIVDTLNRIGQCYPKFQVATRIQRAVRRMRDGEHWADSLLRVRMISPADSAILKAAERVTNLPWALDELSRSIERRMHHRFRMLCNGIFIVLVLMFGFFVWSYCIAFMVPLIKLMTELQ